MKVRTLALIAALAIDCAPRGGAVAIPTAPDVVLGADAAPISLTDLTKRSPLTVLLFFASDCPVQKAHDGRLRELVAEYEPKGVSFAAVLSETGTDVAADRAEVRRRGFAMPVFEDRGAALADALGVEYSTHVLLLEPSRRVLYSGAFDSERTHLTSAPEAYLRDALDAALAGRAVAKNHVEALGCPLRKH